MSENTTTNKNITFKAKATVRVFKAAAEGKKTHQVTFKVSEIDGIELPVDKIDVYADVNTWTAEDFPDDQVGEITVEKVVDKENDRKFFYSLQSWNGKAKEAYQGKKGGNGRGGGGGYVRTPQEIHASAIAGVVKSAFELCNGIGKTDLDQIKAYANMGVQVYIEGVKKAAEELK